MANDPLEVGASYICCPDGRLLTEGMQLRCDAPAPYGTLATHLLANYPPFPLRVASAHSTLAGHLYRLLATQPDDGLSVHDDAYVAQGTRIGQLARTFVRDMRAAGVRPTVVLLPIHPLHRQTYTRIPLALAETRRVMEGLPVIDATTWREQDPAPMWSGYWHLSRAGHTAFATWLGPAMKALDATRPPLPQRAAGAAP